MFKDKLLHGALLAAAATLATAGCGEGGDADDIQLKTGALSPITCYMTPNNGTPVPAGYFRTDCGPASGNLQISTCTCYPLSPTNPVVTLDWSMPDQTGVDTDGDGVVNLSPPGNPPTAGSFLTPANWRATLNACGSTRAPGYGWDITRPTGVQHIDTTGCSATFDAPQGTYHVVVTAKYGNGWKSFAREVTLKNYLVVSIGDSIASGEGNPDVPQPTGTGWRGPNVKWENKSCHRSAKSGPAQAALKLERADAHSSVTFISEACSGAGITMLPGVNGGGGGVLTEYVGQEPLANGAKWMAQLGAVAKVLCPSSANVPLAPGSTWVNPVKSQCRSIDALLVQAGANDVGFGLAAAACALPQFDCSQNYLLTNDIANGVYAYDGKLDQLAAAIKNGLNVTNVFFAEYPDILHSETGALCNSIVLPNAIEDIASNGSGFFKEAIIRWGLSAADFDDGEMVASEIKWLNDFLLTPLNAKVAAATARHKWVAVPGVASDFRTHGYCSSSPWVVKYPESVSSQGGPDGTFHPNAAGHLNGYANRIYASMIANLPGGAALGAPRSTKFGDYSNFWGGSFYGNRGTFLGDVDHDGRQDLIAVTDGYIAVIRSNKTAFGGYEVWFTGNFFGSRGTLVGDVDGDGDADVVALNEGNVTVKRSTGSAFGATETWWTQPFYGSKANFLADVDGDGDDDLVGVGDNYIGVIRSTRSGFGAYENWLSGAFYGAHGTFMGDIDGDRRADLVGLGDGYTAIMKSTGSSFASYANWFGSYWGSHGTLLNDVTGDGLADLVALNDASISVLPSTGTTFAGSTFWWNGPFYGSHGTLLGDVTGDGRADLVGMGDGYVGETPSSP
jgi:hypothetical protein